MCHSNRSLFCFSLLLRVDTTRVEFTISLRENWSLPFLALQVSAITCYLRPQLSILQQVNTNAHPQQFQTRLKHKNGTFVHLVGQPPVSVSTIFIDAESFKNRIQMSHWKTVSRDKINASYKAEKYQCSFNKHKRILKHGFRKYLKFDRETMDETDRKSSDEPFNHKTYCVDIK